MDSTSTAATSVVRFRSRTTATALVFGTLGLIEASVFPIAYFDFIDIPLVPSDYVFSAVVIVSSLTGAVGLYLAYGWGWISAVVATGVSVVYGIVGFFLRSTSDEGSLAELAVVSLVTAGLFSLLNHRGLQEACGILVSSHLATRRLPVRSFLWVGLVLSLVAMIENPESFLALSFFTYFLFHFRHHRDKRYTT